MFWTSHKCILDSVVIGGRCCSAPQKDVNSLVQEACVLSYLCCEPYYKGSKVNRSALSTFRIVIACIITDSQ